MAAVAPGVMTRGDWAPRCSAMTSAGSEPAFLAGEADRQPGVSQGVAEAGPELLAQGILALDGPLLSRSHQYVQFQIEAAAAFRQMAVALYAMALAQGSTSLATSRETSPLGAILSTSRRLRPSTLMGIRVAHRASRVTSTGSM